MSVKNWPALGWESRVWDWSAHGSRPSGRAERVFRHFRSAVPPFIASASPAFSAEATQCIAEAQADISILEHGVGEFLVELGGFLLRSESVASSKIERLSAPPSDVLAALAGMGAGRIATQIAANVRAMQRGMKIASRNEALGTADILSVHRALMEKDEVDSAWAGRLRDRQNWIGGSDISPRDALFVPPAPELIAPLLEDLVHFANRQDLSSLVQSAIVHAQFETIHPFVDGNGRVGRALIHVVLRKRMAIKKAIVPISTALLANTERYFSALEQMRMGDLDGWVIEFAKAASTAAREGMHLASDLRTLSERWLSLCSPRSGSALESILSALIRQPIVNLELLQTIVNVADKNIYDAIDTLADAGVLQETTGGRRNRVWIAPDVVDLVQRFESRVGRRRRAQQV